MKVQIKDIRSAPAFGQVRVICNKEDNEVIGFRICFVAYYFAIIITK